MTTEVQGRFLVVRRGLSIVHPIAQVVRYIQREDGTELPVFKECETPYPEPVCSCGYYILEWKHA